MDELIQPKTLGQMCTNNLINVYDRFIVESEQKLKPKKPYCNFQLIKNLVA